MIGLLKRVVVVMEEKEKQSRRSTGFLIKQRAFLKAYIIRYVEEGSHYGLQIKDRLKLEFDAFGYKPEHSEIYRALHELTEEGYLRRVKKLEEGSTYKEIVLYYINDSEKSKGYMELVIEDLHRCHGMLSKSVKDITN